MLIKKEFNKHKKGEWSECGYVYTVKYDAERNYVFINHENLKEIESSFINCMDLNSEEFLKSHNIEYMINKDKEIIPVGIVQFVQNNSLERIYNTPYLKLRCNDEKELHLFNQIISNIDEAIRIKYEAVKFNEKVGKIEEIEL